MKCVKCNVKNAWHDGMCKECCEIEYNKVTLNIDMTREELEIFQKFIRISLSMNITAEERNLLNRFAK
jgi:hypothetical protein